MPLETDSKFSPLSAWKLQHIPIPSPILEPFSVGLLALFLKKINLILKERNLNTKEQTGICKRNAYVG